MAPLRSVMAAALPAPERELDMLFKRQPISVLATLALSLIVAFALWNKLAGGVLMLWLLAVLLISLWRYESTRRYLRAVQQGIDFGRWNNVLLGGAVASAACWGALPWLVADDDHAGLQFTAFCIAGVTAFATAALSSSTRIVGLFLAAALLPLALRLFVMGGEVNAYTAFTIVLYLFMMLAVALHLQKILRGALQLDTRNSELNETLERLRSLDRENAMFRNMVEMAGATPIMLHDPLDGFRVRYANDAACRHFGVDRATLLKRRPADWDMELDEARLAQVVKQIEITGGAAFETHHRRVSGEIVPVSVLVSEFIYEGKPYGVSIARDLSSGELSSRDRQELETLRYLSRFEASIPGSLFTCRRRGERYEIPYVSASIYEVHGVSAGRICADARTLWQSVHGDDRASLLQAFARSAATLEMLELDYRIVHPAKGERWIHARAMPQCENDGGTVWHGFAYDVTEARRHEERERQRQAEFRALVEGSPDVVVRYDRELCRSYLNPAWELVNGVAAADVLGKTPTELAGVVVPFAADYEAKLRAVLDSGQAAEIELNWRNAQGEAVCFLQRAVPEFDKDGEVVGVLTVARDISGRKRVEEQLSRREGEFRALAENAPDPIFRYDREGRRTYVNAAGVRMSGRSRETLLGSSLGAMPLLGAAERGKLQACVRQVLETGLPADCEVEFAAPDGRKYVYYNRCAPEFDAHGEVASVLSISTDVTERKRMEQELGESRSRLLGMMHTIPDMIWLKDAQGLYLSCNHAFERLVGKSEFDIIGGTDYDLFDAELADFFRDKDRAAIEAGRICVNEEWVSYAGSGQRALLETRKMPVFGEDGKVAGVLGVARDITERRSYEQAMQAKRQELELSRSRIERAEARYRSVLQSAPDGMLVVDRAGVVVMVNEQVELMFGYMAQELCGQAVELLLPPALRGEHVAKREWFVAGLQGKRQMGAGVVGLQGCRKDGSIFPVDVSLSLLPAFDGDEAAVCAAVRDISERRRMEDALARREQEFRMLVENTPDTISRYDCDCRRIYANPALLASSGVRADMLIGTRPSQFPGGDSAERYEATLREVLASGVDADFELSWRGADGRQVHSLIRMTPELGPDGAVVSVLAVGRDITEMVEYREKIHDLAFYDTVTGLANRALFGDRINQAIADASWHGTLFGVMVLDLDRFKAVNDTLGHQVGDMLLRCVAEHLTLNVRIYDTVARLGGDEFAILLPEIRDAQSLGGIAEKIVQALAEPFVLDGKDIFVGASIGIATYPGDAAEAQNLLKFADLAMYAAKQAGGNCFRYYSEELTSRAQQRMQLETELRRALERGEFELYFQPKVDVADGRTIGSEALLRWNSAKFGLVAPDSFIGIAEDTGMIVKIGEWVLYEACRTACAWNAAGMPRHKVAVNLSSRQFYGADLPATIRQALQETGCRAEWIELEITESLLLDNAAHVRLTLESLRAMGFTIAIDDFGTGYSALSYLTNFPIDVLKIDRSFVRDMLVHPNKAELVKAIIGMVDCLHMAVVAEGVETREQAVFLLENGCRTAQGYYYGKPVKKTEFAILQQLMAGA